MRILAFTDIHSSLLALKTLEKKVKEKKPDLLISAGDMTVFGDRMEWVMKRIAKMGVPTLVIPGNHEEENPLAAVCKRHKNLIYIHKKTYVMDNILFIGHGGEGFSYTTPDFEKWVTKIKDKIKGFKMMVLVTHQPPYNTRLDDVYGNQVGSKTYRKFIQQYTSRIKLHVCGHIHECARRHDKIGKTRVINPGPLGVLIRTEFKG